MGPASPLRALGTLAILCALTNSCLALRVAPRATQPCPRTSVHCGLAKNAVSTAKTADSVDGAEDHKTSVPNANWADAANGKTIVSLPTKPSFFDVLFGKAKTADSVSAKKAVSKAKTVDPVGAKNGGSKDAKNGVSKAKNAKGIDAATDLKISAADVDGAKAVDSKAPVSKERKTESSIPTAAQQTPALAKNAVSQAKTVKAQKASAAAAGGAKAADSKTPVLDTISSVAKAAHKASTLHNTRVSKARKAGSAGVAKDLKTSAAGADGPKTADSVSPVSKVKDTNFSDTTAAKQGSTLSKNGVSTQKTADSVDAAEDKKTSAAAATWAEKVGLSKPKSADSVEAAKNLEIPAADADEVKAAVSETSVARDTDADASVATATDQTAAAAAIAAEEEMVTRPGVDLVVHADDAWLHEMNTEHQEDLKVVARVMAPAGEADFERIEHVEIVAADQDGMQIEEILCSAVDDRCIALTVPISWPAKCTTAEEMRAAFDQLSAQAAELDVDSMPQRYVTQQQQLEGLMQLLNRDFSQLVRFFGMRFGRPALSPTEQLESVEMTHLNLQGFTLELTAMELAKESLPRTRSHICVLFEHACESGAEVEDMLISMFSKESSTSETAQKV